MTNPSQIGATAEAEVATALRRAGMTIFVPLFAPHSRVDLVVDGPRGLLRVQCKTSRVRENVVRFRTCSNTSNRPLDYRGEIDAFGVWSPPMEKAFLVPVDVCGLRLCSLRLGPTGNNQVVGVLHAADFEVRPFRAPR